MRKFRLPLLLAIFAGLCVIASGQAMTNFPDGLQSYGIPLPANDYTTTGNYWFVDSGHAAAKDSADRGKTPDKPFATLDFAIGRATANNGDIIFVAPGHVETVNQDNEVKFDVAGIRVVGLGQGAQRPTFTWSARAGSLAIDAHDVSLENMRFLMAGPLDGGVSTSVAANLSGVTHYDSGITAANCANTRIKNCEIITGVTVGTIVTPQGRKMFSPLGFGTGVSRFLVENCTFYSDPRIGKSGTSRFVTFSTNNNHSKIIGCKFEGYTDQGAVYSASAVSDFLLTDCEITEHSPNKAIQLTSSAYGVIKNVHISCGQRDNAIDPGLCSLSNISWSDTGSNGDFTNVPNIEREGYIHLPVSFASATWNKTATSHEILTVTGNVRVKIFPVCTTSLTVAAGGGGSISLGIAGDTDYYLPGIVVTEIDGGEIWTGVTSYINTSLPMESGVTGATAHFAGTNGSPPKAILDYVVTNGVDIGYCLNSKNCNAGVIQFHVWWEPLTPGSFVTAGAGGTL